MRASHARDSGSNPGRGTTTFFYYDVLIDIMKLGYPCINRSIGCTANSTFRLANYSKENMIEKVSNNLNCLEKILEYNVKHDLMFFRISSDVIPFASHPICKFDWKKYFKTEFKKLGEYNNVKYAVYL